MLRMGRVRRRRRLLLPLLVVLLLVLLSRRRRLPRRLRSAADSSVKLADLCQDLVTGWSTLCSRLFSCGLCIATYPSGRRTNSQLLTLPSGSGMYGWLSSWRQEPSTMNLYWWYLCTMDILVWLP